MSNRDDFMKMIEEMERKTTLKRGQLIKGKVLKVGRDEVIVDVGGKSEGVINSKELSNHPFSSPSEIVSVGETIDVIVLREETEEGQIQLSKKRADQMSGWKSIMADKEADKVVEFTVTGVVKGGVVADAYGLRGFIPATHLRHRGNLDELVGKTLPVKVVDLDPTLNKLILSHTKALAVTQSAQRSKILEELETGQIRKGVVTRVMDFGAFVDIGGLDALLPISEISWKKVKHPSEVVKANEEIEALVYKIEDGKVTLSLKRLTPDPWTKVEGKYVEGQKIVGKVINIVDFGVFVELEPGIEGLLPANEISDEKINLREKFRTDEEITSWVKSCKPQERKIVLSLKAEKREESAS